jgi:hypothetical protein
MAVGNKVVHLQMGSGLGDGMSLGRQNLEITDASCQDLQICGVIQGLKSLEGGEHILGADADTVVFQQHDITALCEALTDVLTQLIAAGDGIHGDLYLGADLPHRGKQVQVGALTNGREGHQCGGMGVEHGLQVGTHLINRCVEGIFRGRTVGTDTSAIRLNANDVLAGQGTLIDTCGGNPNVTVVVHNGEVTAGCGGQTLVVNALHKHNKLVCGMNVIDIHKKPPIFFLIISYPLAKGKNYLQLCKKNLHKKYSPNLCETGRVWGITACG